MTRHSHTAALLVALAVSVPAQTSPQSSTPAPLSSPRPAPRPAVPYINHNLIFLDPAHGGPDSGAHLSDTLLEKDVTLALAGQIRSLLSTAARDVSVVLAREADPAPAPPPSNDPDQPVAPTPPPTTPTPDQRAGNANHARPVACILLHATASGNGVHLVTSPLNPPDSSLAPASPALATRWETAQAASVSQSLRLANEIGISIARANLPVHLSRASVRPIDNLLCPAVAIEIAPVGSTPVSDPGYQRHVAEAVATALLFWRGHADPPPGPVQTPGEASNPGAGR